jgi:Periplasmic protease
MKAIKTIIQLFVILVICIPLVCCKKNPPTPSSPDLLATEKSYLYNSVMTDIYYWSTQVPTGIDRESFTTLEEYFEALLAPKDRWSWMTDGPSWLNSEAGISTTYGMSLAQATEHYNDYNIMVRYVYPGSPMSENGVERGYELTHLNDIPVMDLVGNQTFNTVLNRATNKFTYKDRQGVSFSFNATQREINTHSYLSEPKVFTSTDFPGLPYSVGYFHYRTFNNNMEDDIRYAMNIFYNAGIKELILDLRYNSGGSIPTAALLASYIAPPTANGKIFAKRRHNRRYSQWDNIEATISKIERNAHSLNLDRVIILTTNASASASEMIIAGLDPLMEVVQVGRSSNGKPCGMYLSAYPENNFTNPTYVFYPICFYSVNSVGFGEYEDGLVPDYERYDDLYHDFGIEEDFVKASLTFISTGTMPSLPPPTRSSGAYGKKIATEEDSPNYGRAYAKPPK